MANKDDGTSSSMEPCMSPGMKCLDISTITSSRGKLTREILHDFQHIRKLGLTTLPAHSNIAMVSNSPTLTATKEAFDSFPDLDLHVGPDVSLVPSGVLPPITNSEDAETSAHIKVFPTVERDGILVSIRPPKAPADGLTHVPCDIVLSIDASPSMGTKASTKTGSSGKRDRDGTILDRMKRAACFIIEALGAEDRLAIVKFSSSAEVVQELLPMTPGNKKIALSNVAIVQVDNCTSRDLRRGSWPSVNVFENHERSNCIPAILIMTATDSHCASSMRDCVEWLQSQHLSASIYTFGFGQQHPFGLLKSAAEVGLGTCALVHNQDMIASNFTNTLANLKATYATNVVLTVDTSHDIILKDITGLCLLEKEHESEQTNQEQFSDQGKDTTNAANTIRLGLGSLQYGQSRDVFLMYEGKQPFELLSGAAVFASATLIPIPGEDEQPLRTIMGGCMVDEVHNEHDQEKQISPKMLAYHRTRAQICQQLNRLFAADHEGKDVFVHTALLQNLEHYLDAVAGGLRYGAFQSSLTQALLDDWDDDISRGRLCSALSRLEHFNK